MTWKKTESELEEKTSAREKIFDHHPEPEELWPIERIYDYPVSLIVEKMRKTTMSSATQRLEMWRRRRMTRTTISYLARV